MTDGPFYTYERDRFLAGCGEMSEPERERAHALFDQTLCAERARLGDALSAFLDLFLKSVAPVLVGVWLVLAVAILAWEVLL